MMHDFEHKRNQKELFYLGLSAVPSFQRRLLIVRAEFYGERKAALHLLRGLGGGRK